MAEEGEEIGQGEGSEEAVRVFVRIRPLNKRELAENQTIGWNFNETSLLEDTPNGQKVYAYDRCFGPIGNNREVYDIVGKPVVLKAMEGYNGTVFTYGQTGSGKTFTMRGSDADPGMMILCIRDIFDYIEHHSSKTKFLLKASYMEVYNEEINDLLGSGPASKNLKIISEDAIRGAVIEKLVEEIVSTPEELLEVLKRGEFNRSYGSTIMNAESSRSHTIYRLVIESNDIDEDEPNSKGGFQMSHQKDSGPQRISFLNLVDLAGSERQKSTGASGKTLKEGANINKSLLSLGAVISKLGELSKTKMKGAKPAFIPYRDSKLTRILKQSLGGNTMTSILCTVTPAPMHREETVSTLKFGQLCKTIKNNVKSNEMVDDKTIIKQLKATIQELRSQLAEYESGEGGHAHRMRSSTHDEHDTESLQHAQQEKLELEAKVKSLEQLVRGGSGSAGGPSEEASAIITNLTEALSSAQANNSSLQSALSETKKEVKKLNTKIATLEDQI